MDVLEASLLEELVSGVRQVVSDAHDSRDQLCAATKMCLSAEIFTGEALRWKGILGRICCTYNLDLVYIFRADLKLKWLSLLRTANEFTSS